MLKYYLKKSLSNKSFVFWTAMFPICLMICFKFAFGNLYDIENKIDPVELVYVNADGNNINESMDRLIERLGLKDIISEYELDKFVEAIYDGDVDYINNFNLDEEAFKESIENAELDKIDLSEDELKELGIDNIDKLLYSVILDMSLTSLSTEGEDQLFILERKDSIEEAEALLDNGDKKALLICQDGVLRAELSSDYSQVDLIVLNTFIKSFDSAYTMTVESLKNESENSISLSDLNFDNSLDEGKFINETYIKVKESVFEEEPNPYNWYYYATFVMGIMFNIISGIGIVADIQANLSKAAMRVGLSSTSKGKIFIATFISRFIIIFVCDCFQLLIMKYIFEIPIGNRIPQILLFIIVAIVFTLSLGEVLGLFLKGDISKRENTANALLMTSVFLSGEMMASLPGIFEANCPWINRINPATVLNFSFYNLVYYEDLAGFYNNLFKIIIAAIICIAISIVKIRRQKYASL